MPSKFLSLRTALLGLAGSSLSAATIGVVGNTPVTARAGATFAYPCGLNAILIFTLPALPAGSTVSRATITCNYASKSGTPAFSAAP